jgi:septum formation protein
MRILLASSSPRRLSLLKAAGLEVEVRPAAVDELRAPGELPGEMAFRLARDKAWAIAEDERLPIIAADTVVALQGKVLGKPLHERDAAGILRRLSGEEHEVITGFCVRYFGEERRGTVRTQVWFRSLSDAEIERYVRTGEPMDKAGAYGIQGEGGALVDRVSGSYTNVVGLPLSEVLWELEGLAGPR